MASSKVVEKSHLTQLTIMEVARPTRDVPYLRRARVCLSPPQDLSSCCSDAAGVGDGIKTDDDEIQTPEVCRSKILALIK